jgi:hypothetical protein
MLGKATNDAPAVTSDAVQALVAFWSSWRRVRLMRTT